MPSPDLKTSTTRIDDALVCSLAGYVHMDNEEHLRHELSQALAQHPAVLAIDLHAVDLFTTNALNALLTTRSAALALGVPLVLAAPSPQAQRVLKITQTDAVFQVRPTLTEALRHRAPSTSGAPHPAASSSG
ncbi:MULTISPECIES: STAS domain-containing protein [Kitasatospora]|uniref:STAS domain-containing protein n=1 Tax=Kitasatospora cystarginea TaxID=58350 RepID=A0ABP5RXG6_9ACTN